MQTVFFSVCLIRATCTCIYFSLMKFLYTFTFHTIEAETALSQQFVTATLADMFMCCFYVKRGVPFLIKIFFHVLNMLEKVKL